MFGIHDLALFVAAGVILNLTPGPDTFLIVTRSSTLGARAGFAVVAGIFCGCFVHIVAAAVGLSAILVASATAFSVIKFAGAAYLIYIGVQLLIAPARPLTSGNANTPAAGAAGAASANGGPGLRRLFAEGFLCNALNPKVAVFFLAFLPQFVDPGQGDAATAFLVLGMIFNLTGIVWNSCTNFLASRFRVLLREPAAALLVNRIAGVCFLGFGVKLAVTER
ncbi:MAG: LysE family translocator [Burkholderiales bacterium]|nr:LysE family translocator [Burkholderiales bacterium]